MPFYPHHRPLDSSVQDLDREELPYGCSRFISHLIDEMHYKDIPYLSLHYPELVFSFVKGKKVPQPKPDFKVQFGGGWVVANWRTTALP